MKPPQRATPRGWWTALLLIVFVCAVLSKSLSLVVGVANPDQPRTPLPNAAAQRAALKTVDEVYRDEIKNAKEVIRKSALAKKLMTAGLETRDDPAEKYILLKKSVELAGQAGDFPTARAASRALGAAFEIDNLAATSDLVSSIAKLEDTEATTGVH